MADRSRLPLRRLPVTAALWIAARWSEPCLSDSISAHGGNATSGSHVMFRKLDAGEIRRLFAGHCYHPYLTGPLSALSD